MRSVLDDLRLGHILDLSVLDLYSSSPELVVMIWVLGLESCGLGSDTYGLDSFKICLIKKS